MLSVAAVLAMVLWSPNADAKPGDSAPSFGSRLFDAFRPSFEAPRPSWSMAPPLRLQPEGARLTLELPNEWMPAPDYGVLRIPFDPNKHWQFRRATRTTRATIGASVHLQVTDRSRSIDFGLSLLPRAAIATLRFDPLAGAK
jgi:hypothetical protein